MRIRIFVLHLKLLLMSSSKFNLSFIALTIVLTACESQPKETSVPQPVKSEAQVPVGDNSQNSLDWAGVYSGVVPCADCTGIETKIALNNDLTFNLDLRYLGKSNEIIAHSGSFKWNAEGSIITLENPEYPLKFQVGENKLTQLDINGAIITGVLANNYILSKAQSTLADVKWTLVELYGKSVSAGQGLTNAPFVVFNSETSKITGNSGCNNISGKFELGSAGKITTNNVFATMNPCGDVDSENLFQRAVRNVQSYEINGKELVLTEPEWPKSAILIME